MAKGCRLLDIVGAKRPYTFIFENPEVCEVLKNDYMNGGEAPARDLLQTMKSLTQEMKEKENNNKENYDKNQWR